MTSSSCSSAGFESHKSAEFHRCMTHRARTVAKLRSPRSMKPSSLTDRSALSFRRAHRAEGAVEELLRLAAGAPAKQHSALARQGDCRRCRTRLTQAVFDAVARDGRAQKREWNYYPVRWRERSLDAVARSAGICTACLASPGRLRVPSKRGCATSNFPVLPSA